MIPPTMILVAQRAGMAQPSSPVISSIRTITAIPTMMPPFWLEVVALKFRSPSLEAILSVVGVPDRPGQPKVGQQQLAYASQSARAIE